MLPLVTVVYCCYYCGVELKRKMFCSPKHKVYSHRGKVWEPNDKIKEDALVREMPEVADFTKAPATCPKHGRFRSLSDPQYPCGCKVKVKYTNG